MSIIDLIFKREEQSAGSTSNETTEQTTDTPQDLLLKSLLRGEKITRDKALSVPAVSSAVDRISNLIAMLPIRMYKYVTDDKGNRKIEEVLDDNRLYILNQDTGDLLDPFQLKKSIVNDYLTNKGAYVYIEKYRNEFKALKYVEQIMTQFLKMQNIMFMVKIMNCIILLQF